MSATNAAPPAVARPRRRFLRLALLSRNHPQTATTRRTGRSERRNLPPLDARRRKPPQGPRDPGAKALRAYGLDARNIQTRSRGGAATRRRTLRAVDPAAARRLRRGRNAESSRRPSRRRAGGASRRRVRPLRGTLDDRPVASRRARFWPRRVPPPPRTRRDGFATARRTHLSPTTAVAPFACEHAPASVCESSRAAAAPAIAPTAITVSSGVRLARSGIARDRSRVAGTARAALPCAPEQWRQEPPRQR